MPTEEHLELVLVVCTNDLNPEWHLTNDHIHKIDSVLPGLLVVDL